MLYEYSHIYIYILFYMYLYVVIVVLFHILNLAWKYSQNRMDFMIRGQIPYQ